MSNTSLPGGYERFSSRADVKGAIASIDNELASLNEALSYSSPSYDSLVLFSVEKGSPIATPLSTVDAYDTDPWRHYFRDDAVMNRRLLRKGTALDMALTEGEKADLTGLEYEPEFIDSRINTEYDQITYTQRIKMAGQVLAAVQYSFTAKDHREGIGYLPDSKELKDIWQKHQKEMSRVALSVDLLQDRARETGAPLAAGLEMEDPIAPNAFLIRWDVEGATALARGSKKAALRSYLNAVHSQLSELTARYSKDRELSTWNIHEAYDDQGDGAYIILPIPFSTYDAQYLKDYSKYTAPRFMGDTRAAIDEVSAQFPDLAPAVHLSGDFGYAEGNSVQRLDSYLMYALADLQKEK